MKKNDSVNVLITGANGFIGKNLYVALKEIKNISILTYTRNQTMEELEQLLKNSDVIYHLAGVNRAKDDGEFVKGNIQLTEQMTEILRKINRKPTIVMSSSIQATNNTTYGRSKKKAEEILEKYALETNNSQVFIYRLTNVFGKWAKPHYNSVVATFCYNIARGTDIVIHDPEKEVELVYIGDVVKVFNNHLYNKIETESKQFIYTVADTYKITLGKLAATIYEFHNSRDNLIMPDLSHPLTKFLYSTYLSYLEQHHFSYDLEMKKDHRGTLIELIKSNHFGQIFISSSHPGVIRGNHYHHTKVEKFCVIKGKANIKLRHIISNEIVSYVVTGDKVQIVDIPPGYTHSLENIGENELIVLFWANEIFEKDRPDTFFEEVENE